jgi:hypothetical protein
MTKPGKYTPRALSYEESPAQVKNREARNKARADAEKTGKSIAGKDIAHIVALKNRGSKSDANTRPESIAQNRGWRKGQRGYRVPNEK